MSFKGQPWELYNLANDRTEQFNLAESEPDRVKAMVKKWDEISLNVLHSKQSADFKMKPAEKVKSNREWTKFSDSLVPPEK